MIRKTKRVAVAAWELGVKIDLQTGQSRTVSPDADVIAQGTNAMLDAISNLENLDGEIGEPRYVTTESHLICTVSFGITLDEQGQSEDEARPANVVEFASRAEVPQFVRDADAYAEAQANNDIRVTPSEF